MITTGPPGSITRCCGIIVLNAHAPREDKNNLIKDNFYEKFDILDHFPQIPHDSSLLLGDFNAKSTIG